VFVCEKDRGVGGGGGGGKAEGKSKENSHTTGITGIYRRVIQGIDERLLRTCLLYEYF
jgi:hypothetical protein